jgi:hypothetical protein
MVDLLRQFLARHFPAIYGATALRSDPEARYCISLVRINNRNKPPTKCHPLYSDSVVVQRNNR